MPIKMIASRLHYYADHGKEYKAGETFTVASEMDAVRLERRRKAMRATTAAAKPVHVDPPKPAAPPAAPVELAVEAEATAPVQDLPIGTEEPMIETDVPAGEGTAEGTSSKRQYRRRDLSAEQD